MTSYCHLNNAHGRGREVWRIQPAPWCIVLTLLYLACCSIVPARAQEVEISEALIKLIDQAEVASLEAGVLSKVAVQEGDEIKAGSLLAQLDTLDAELLLIKTENDVEIAAAEARSVVRVQLAEATRAAADAELQRARESIRKFPRSVSQSELDRYELAYRQAELAIRQAEHEQAIAQLTLKLRESDRVIAQRQIARRRIVAPFDGTVVQLYRRAGEWVEPGEKVLRLVRTDRVRAEGFLPADQAKRAKLDSPAKLVLAGGATFTGKLMFVSPELDPVTKQVRVLAEFENPRLELRPGMSARLVLRP